MGEPIGVDSNALTYLIDATEPGYNPAKDEAALASERIAMLRIFLYGDRGFWVSPTVKQEYVKIRDQCRYVRHDSFTGCLLLDQSLEVPEQRLEARARELTRHHAGTRDCRILAEVESMGLDTLLSFDPEFVHRLESHTAVRMTSPSAFWQALEIPTGTPPVWSPAPSNPLALVNWWRI